MPRSKRDRARGFVFYPDDYLNDPMVRRMTCLGRGAYSSLLFALWSQPRPGVVEDDDQLLASLALSTPEEWSQVKADVARCFDTETEPGFWLQKRMALQHTSRQRKYRQQIESGRVGGKAKAANAKARVGTFPVHENSSEPLPERGTRNEEHRGNVSSETLPALCQAPIASALYQPRARKPLANGHTADPPPDLEPEEFVPAFDEPEYEPEEPEHAPD